MIAWPWAYILNLFLAVSVIAIICFLADLRGRRRF